MSDSTKATARNPHFAAALDYIGRGWSCFPVVGKKPAQGFKTKQFWSRRPTEDEIREWFEGDSPPNIAIACGAISGDLAVRDFDRVEAYQTWAEDNPSLADRLPTVRTAKGYHAYSRCATRSRVFDDGSGEMRGEGYYVVAPPSIHESGHRYEWIVRPTDLPSTNLETWGLKPESSLLKNSKDRQTSNPSTHNGFDCSILAGFHEGTVEVIEKTLPRGPGRRNACVFKLARHLQGLYPDVNPCSPKSLKPIVREWHRRALRNIQTKAFDETWSDFVYAFSRVIAPIESDGGFVDVAFAHAIRKPLPKCADEYDGPTKLIVALCCELSRSDRRSRSFFLSCIDAGRLIGTSPTTAWRLLMMLCADGVLVRDMIGDRRKASVYRYLGDILD